MTDKDSVQISVAKMIWPDAYIQLCFWYLKRAMKRQLALTKKPKLTQYFPNSANLEFSFIDPNFCFIINNNIEINQSIQLDTQSQNKKLVFIFCPPEYHNHILNLIAKHFNQYLFISTSDNQYCSPNQIRKAASVYPSSPNFFVEVQRYRSLSFWRYKDLILLIQGLEAVDKDKDETDEVDEQIEELNKLLVTKLKRSS
ncbi:37768_t:CDS:2 [Gigaspora margarita]|uniref:37768_t:CDS:1 n=1 Tax=Gigaspora margarita TaxID=4874 RepID=A0ABN7VKB9_GIGMA|nr:37768_t:CDS:2 [Gigaspora margarita]